MDDLLETINYRGLSFPIYLEDEIVYTIIAGKKYKLDCTKRNYSVFVRDSIDRILDNLERYQITDSSYLEYFNNSGYFDLRLVCHGRVLKIFLIGDSSKVNIDSLIKQSQDILTKYQLKLLEKRD